MPTIDFDALLNWTDKQKMAWKAISDGYRYVLYGGARGGGKSRFLRWAAVAWLLMVYKTLGMERVRVGLFCETYTDLRDRQVTKIQLEFPEWMGEVKKTDEDGLCYFLSKEMGSGIIALRNLDDPSKYQSSEFAALFIDELTKIPKQTFDILRGSLRWPGITNRLFLAATNPGSVGHAWVKQLWIDKDFPPEMEKIAHRFKFIQSLPADNPHLDETYWEELDSLPDDLRRAWVLGDWNVFAGQAFPNWRPNKHIIEPFQIPDNWMRWRCLDWGYAEPFCCLWLAKDPSSGRTFVYKEAYARMLTDEQQAKLIKDMTLNDERIVYTLADPSLWARKNFNGSVTTSADQFALFGVPLSRADNNRLQGKRKIDRLLGDLPDGHPGLQIFSNCRHVIRTLPTLARSERNPEDVDGRGEDHCLVGETIVSTDRGNIRLDEVTSGDRVLTRLGYQRVVRSWMTKKNAETYTVKFSDGRQIAGTGNHPIYVVGKGYIDLRSLGYGDTIINEENLSWKTRLLYSMELLSEGILKVKEGLKEYISSQTEDFARKVSIISTEKFGRTVTVKSQQGIMSITKTGIRSITTSLILNACQAKYIFRNMLNNILPRRSTWNTFSLLQENGIRPAMELNGIKRSEGYLGITEQSQFTLVNTAQKNLHRRFQTQSIAATSARRHQEGNLVLTISKNIVQFAGKNLKPASILEAILVRENAVRVIAVEKNQKFVDVYNLSVEGVNEYFANGVLVHNCYDCLRYGLTNFVLMSPEKKVYNNPWVDLRSEETGSNQYAGFI